jgi:hypothetical protein
MTPATDSHSLEQVTAIAPTEAEIKAATLRKLEIDLAEYFRQKEAERVAQDALKSLKPGIIAALSKYGSVPDGAPKSVRIETSEFVSTLTTGTTIDVDDEAVESLRQLLGKTSKLRALFALLFRPRIEYTLQPTARETILHTKWPKAIKDQVVIAYMRCFDAKTNTPALTVDSKAAIAQRQREAEEEAAARAVAAAAKKSRGKAAA